MTQEQWAAVDRYICDLLVPPDPSLDAAIEASAAAGLPRHEVSPNQGKLLYLLARVQGARAILELGTLGGYSTIWLGRGLPVDGRVVTLEADAAYAEVARENLARAGLAEVAEIRVGPALDSLSHLAAAGDGPFDLIFLDADKRSNPEYLEWALELSREGTVIVADNVVRGGAVVEAASGDAAVRGVRRFLELLGAEAGVVATALQTVGSKGYDGFALALVTDER